MKLEKLRKVLLWEGGSVLTLIFDVYIRKVPLTLFAKVVKDGHIIPYPQSILSSLAILGYT